jgi:hypothetical protein
MLALQYNLHPLPTVSGHCLLVFYAPSFVPVALCLEFFGFSFFQDTIVGGIL